MNLMTIPAFAGDRTFHVVVESPRGSTVKLKYEAQWEAMTISRPLPAGLAHPFDSGFVPSTHAPDGDPLDVFVCWDAALFPGVVIECRAIGVLRVAQNRTNFDRSARIRNDRVIAVPVASRREAVFTTLEALPQRVRDEYAQFVVAAAALDGKDVEILGWDGPDAALALVRSATRA